MEIGFDLDISEHLKEILIILAVIFLVIAVIKSSNYDSNRNDTENMLKLNEKKELSAKKKILRDKFGNKYILVQGDNYVKDMHENVFHIYKDGYGNVYLCSNDENGNQYSEKDRLF